MVKTHHNKELSKLYFNPNLPSAFSTPRKLWEVARKEIPDLTLAEVKHWFTTKEVPSRFQQAKKKFKRAVFTTSKANHQWLADLADIGNLKHHNHNFRYLLVVQDLFSRKILGLAALRNKQSKQVAEAFQKILDQQGVAPKIFFTDSGTEFFGEMNKIYEKYNIKHLTSNDFTQKAAPTERAILTLKQRLYKIMAAEKTFIWTDKLDLLLKAFNNSVNRTLGMTPNQAILPKNRSLVFYRSVILPTTKITSLKPPQSVYRIGQIVRILLQQPFGKSYVGNYSQVLYKVYKKALKGGVFVYYLNELLTEEPVTGSFYAEELQPVTLKKDPAKIISKIHSFRLKDHVEEVQVTYANDPQHRRRWVPYSDLIGYS